MALDGIVQADFNGYDDSKLRKVEGDQILIVDGFLDYLNNKENYCDQCRAAEINNVVDNQIRNYYNSNSDLHLNLR